METLNGKTALVTGASRGIGRATAAALAEAGAHVLVHYGRSAQEAESLVAEIQKKGGRAEAISADLGTPDGASLLAKQVRSIATIGNGTAVRRGRDFAVWLGVVPQEHSTSGKQVLWKIPRRGNQYLRMLFVQGARSVMQRRTKQEPCLSAWLAQLTARTHRKLAIVALANKLARIAWAVLTKNEVYRPLLLDGALEACPACR